jgi:glycosyltransferase involved in cell wall biosynthesis
MHISALVNTFNEEERIEDCLKALQWADELVVADMGSSDRTVELAGRYATKVITIAPGNFSEIRNAGLAGVSGDWVLLVDADERVTPELAAEIRARFSGDVRETAYKIPRYNYYMGGLLRHSTKCPEYMLRLFRNDPEHRFTRMVHERLQLSEGLTGRMSNGLVHLMYSSLEKQIHSYNHYTTLAAADLSTQNQRVRFYHLLWRPPIHFLKQYLLRGGFLDGSRGFIFCYLMAVYSFMKTAKVWIRYQQREGKYLDVTNP